MSTLSVQFNGIQEDILNKITACGLAETKSEAIRMALLKLATDFNLIDQRELVKGIRKDLSKDKLNVGKVLADIERVKNAGISR